MLYFRIDYHQPVPFCSYRPSFWFYSYIDDDLLFSFQVLVLYLRIIWFFFWFLPSWSAGGSGLWVFCRPLLFLYFFLVFCICISAAHSYSYLYFLNFVFLFLPPNIILIYTARPSLILVYTSFIPSACPLKIVFFFSGFAPFTGVRVQNCLKSWGQEVTTTPLPPTAVTWTQNKLRVKFWQVAGSSKPRLFD